MVDGISWDQLLEQAGDQVADSYDPLPDDVYDLEVVEASHTMTKTTPSKDMWKVQYKVVGGHFNNRRLFNNIVLTLDSDKALGFFFRNMAAHGLTREYFASKPSNEAVSAALKGRRTRGKTVQKPYNGEIKNEIARYSAPSADAAVGTPPPGATAPPPPAAPPAPVAAPPAPAAPAPPAPAPVAQPAAPAPAPAPAPAAPADPWSGQPAPAPAAPAPGTVPPPPPLEGLPF